MTIEKAIRLARKWAAGHVCTLKEGEAQEYHQMCAEALEKSRWISVTERLPEEDGQYLICTKFYGHTIQQIASWTHCYDGFEEHLRRGAMWYDHDSEWGDYEVSGVTHWMPLPSTEGLNEA